MIRQKAQMKQDNIILLSIQYCIVMNKTHNHILLSIKNSKKMVNAQGTKYPIVKEVASLQGFHLCSDFYTLLWTDHALTLKEIRQLPPHVKINHIPEITTLTRKNKMANALNALLRYYPKEFDFYPETFLLPMDHAMLIKKHQKDKFYIVKPENGCQGRGIYLTNQPSKIQKSSPMIVQRYITNPLLIDGLKFDLRIYVLITCVQPLRIFMFKDGLARFATQSFQLPTEQNADNLYKHLTNYAINKNHQQFTVDDEDYGKGHKRLISNLFSPQILQKVHKSISDIIIKSVISVLPNLQNGVHLSKKDSLNTCFQLLGFDILMTDNGKFKLLQINQNPSLMTETGVDVSLKKQMLSAVFKIISANYTLGEEKSESKIRTKDRKQLQNAGNFKRIYPCQCIQQTQYYDNFILKSQQIYRQKFGMKISREDRRQHQSKEQIDHIQWNQSSQFYSKDKLSKVYGATRNLRTSQKRRIIF